MFPHYVIICYKNIIGLMFPYKTMRVTKYHWTTVPLLYKSVCVINFSVGGVMAGLPLSYVAQVYDWSGAFFMLEVFIGAILILKILTRHLEYKMVPIKKKLQ